MRVRPASLFGLTVLLVLVASPLSGQGLKVAVGDVGLGVGDVPRLDGLRLNFRDDQLRLVRGVNVTIWTPYEHSEGVVQGVALGLPLTGANEMAGLALGAGIAVNRTFSGIGLAAIGLGAGEDLQGIGFGGVGLGTGGDLEGLMIGGVGIGAGRDARGIMIGGVGAGAGGDVTGLAFGGVGVGAGGDVKGILLGGVGVGVGKSLTGLAVGGVGSGAGRDVTGVIIGGVGVGVGGELKGVGIGGIGVGASRITGVALSGFGAGGEHVTGLSLAPAYFKITEGGTLRGVSIAAWNDLRDGEQRGLCIGLLNIADELHGVQVGVINIARNKKRFSVLPLVNWSR